jgi:hypothetical protein
MSSLEDVLTEWKRDSVIDESRLNHELLKTPMIHAKYVEYLMFFKAKLAAAEKKYNISGWKKRKYFRGEMDKDDLDKNGWSQWQGLKPSSSELNQLLEMDRDMNDLQENVANYKAAVSAVEYILKQIQSRDYTLKTVFEYMKYVGGN